MVAHNDSSTDSTSRLVGDWNTGSESALERLVEANLDWIHRRVRARLGERLRRKTDSTDLVQESIMQFLKYGPRFSVQTREDFRNLMCHVVENTIRDENDWFRAKRRSMSQERPLTSESVVAFGGRRDRSVTRPDSKVQREELEARIRIALELVHPDERKVIVLRKWDNLSFAEIGDAIGTSEEAARKRFNRALPSLVEKLKSVRTGTVPPPGRDRTPS